MFAAGRYCYLFHKNKYLTNFKIFVIIYIEKGKEKKNGYDINLGRRFSVFIYTVNDYFLDRIRSLYVYVFGSRVCRYTQ